MLGRSLLVFLLLLPAAGAWAQPAPDAAIQQGYSLIYSGAKTDAARHFERLLTQRPDDLGLRFGLAMAEHERLDLEPVILPAFERRLDGLIALAETRHGRNARDAEALFYLAQAHMLRATYRFERDKGMWGAARDGAKAKSYSEEYIKQYPGHADAYLTLGLYNYYVDIIPTFFKVFRFLMFLPSGNRVEGLKQIERAAAQGVLLGPQAQGILVEVYSQFEGRTAEALALAERLQRQYPQNDELGFALGTLYAGPGLEDRNRAAAIYQQIADRRRTDESAEGLAARYNALSAVAGARVDQWRVDEAIAVLTPVIDANVRKPDWVLPQFLLRRGNYRALLNDPAAAEDARRVQSNPQLAKWHEGAAGQLKWIAARRATTEAAIYASLIPANRLAVEGRWDEARKLYEEVRTRAPQDPQVRFRLAHLLFLRGETERAIPELLPLSTGGKIVPDPIKASALLDIARAHDLAGRRDAARKTYQRIIDNYETQRAAQAARLGLLTPYKRPQSSM